MLPNSNRKERAIRLDYLEGRQENPEDPHSRLGDAFYSCACSMYSEIFDYLVDAGERASAATEDQYEWAKKYQTASVQRYPWNVGYITAAAPPVATSANP